MSPMTDSELVETSFVNTVLPRSTTIKEQHHIFRPPFVHSWVVAHSSFFSGPFCTMTHCSELAVPNNATLGIIKGTNQV